LKNNSFKIAWFISISMASALFTLDFLGHRESSFIEYSPVIIVIVSKLLSLICNTIRIVKVSIKVATNKKTITQKKFDMEKALVSVLVEKRPEMVFEVMEKTGAKMSEVIKFMGGK